jgi:hypothetical protein
MFANLRIHTVFKRPSKEQKPARAHSGQGAASVVPNMKADQDSRFTEPVEAWSVLAPLDEGEARAGRPSG